MTRREALTNAAMLLGGVISAPVIAAVMQGCKADPSLPPSTTFLTAGQEKAVSIMTDLILPKTSTPGAVEAGVPAFIFTVLQDCFSEEDRQAFALGLNELDDAAKSDQGRRFLKLSTDKQVAFLKKTDETARAAQKDQQALAPLQAAWLRLKELTLVGYFTSEIGATEALEYLPIPARLDTCADMPEGQRAWAV